VNWRKCEVKAWRDEQKLDIKAVIKDKRTKHLEVQNVSVTYGCKSSTYE